MIEHRCSHFMLNCFRFEFRGRVRCFLSISVARGRRRQEPLDLSLMPTELFFLSFRSSFHVSNSFDQSKEWTEIFWTAQTFSYLSMLNIELEICLVWLTLARRSAWPPTSDHYCVLSSAWLLHFLSFSMFDNQRRAREKTTNRLNLSLFEIDSFRSSDTSFFSDRLTDRHFTAGKSIKCPISFHWGSGDSRRSTRRWK